MTSGRHDNQYAVSMSHEYSLRKTNARIRTSHRYHAQSCKQSTEHKYNTAFKT